MIQNVIYDIQQIILLLQGKPRLLNEKLLQQLLSFPCQSLRKSRFGRRKEEMPAQEGQWRKSQLRWRIVQWRWRIVQWIWRCNNCHCCIQEHIIDSRQSCYHHRGTIKATAEGRLTNHFQNIRETRQHRRPSPSPAVKRPIVSLTWR